MPTLGPGMDQEGGMSKITTWECWYRGCLELRTYEFFGRKTRLCNVTGRIPGNMSGCPKDVDDEKVMP